MVLAARFLGPKYTTAEHEQTQSRPSTLRAYTPADTDPRGRFVFLFLPYGIMKKGRPGAESVTDVPSLMDRFMYEPYENSNIEGNDLLADPPPWMTGIGGRLTLFECYPHKIQYGAQAGSGN